MIEDMKTNWKIVLFAVVLSWGPLASGRIEKFTGEAKENGKLVYIEKHEVTFDDKDNVLTATTIYSDPDGKELGVLKSDFTRSLSLPEHVFTDDRTKGQYGIRRDSEKIILFNHDDGKSEETKVLTEPSDSSRLLVGCQGFSYYLKDKIEDLRSKKSQPVLFLIPGDLSSYRFVLEFVKEGPDKIFEFRVKIENWWLRAFAPTLEFKYDAKVARVVWYKGVSNIKNSAGKTMNVVIDYKY
ncbi:hypothetical protein BH10BDE1_BH10BDE1_36280 [soil metagenome]